MEEGKSPKAQWKLNLWWQGLCWIVLVYSMFYVWVYDNPDILEVPRTWRNFIKFLTTIGIYLLGTRHLGKLHVRWMGILWHFVHLGGLSLLLVFGTIDMLLEHRVPIELRTLTNFVVELLISPSLYVGMGLLNRWSLKDNS